MLPRTGDGGLKGTGGSPRFGWNNEFGGISIVPGFLNCSTPMISWPSYRSNGNEYILDYTIFIPLNRCFEFQFDYSIIFSNKGGSSNTYHGNTGDLTISNRFKLSESEYSASCLISYPHAHRSRR